MLIVTARKRSLGQGNVSTGICLSTGGGGGSVPACITGHMIGGLCPGGGMGGVCQGDPPYGNERVVRIPLECILV